MKFVWPALLLTSIVAPASGSGASPQPSDIVRAEKGLIQGLREGDALVFKGVPFAAAPVGALRWRPPQRGSAWEGVLKADEFKPMCMTKMPALPGFPMEKTSEDCLYLNIWTPASPPQVKLPVMVYFYGGGQRTGSASAPIYSGEQLVRKGVITVNISYRVGALGFLSHPDLSRESGYGTSGNYGVMDMIAALRWVKRNIRAFGGDPERVTIFGQSAGSTGVGYMMMSPLARGLFHRAIGQSHSDMTPVGPGGGMILPREAEASGVRWATTLGARSIDELRRLPAADLAAADFKWPADAAGHVKGNGQSGSIAVLDGYVFPRSMYDTFSKGAQNDVPLLIGYNANEAGSLLWAPLAAVEYREAISREYGDYARQILALYPGGTEQEGIRSQYELQRDSWFGWQMWTWARLQSQTGRSPSYLYNFSFETPFPDARIRAQGAAHGYELGYVFGHLDSLPMAPTPEMLRMSEIISTYWTNFAKNGDPNGEGVPYWPRFDADHQRWMNLGSPVAARPIPAADLARLVALDVFFASQRARSAR